MKTVRMVLVGGFLGAGKTTLMAIAGRRLAARGMQVGFITNDQAGELVDTALLKQTGIEVKEVAGACFCCKFEELILRTGEFSAHRQPDVLMTEPVGSCTDLSATVLQPIKKFYGDKFRVAPFSVVVDPSRLKELLNDPDGLFSYNVMYVYSKQLEEADCIVLNKTDQLSESEIQDLKLQLTHKFPNAQIITLSAVTGTGVDEWLDIILKDSPAGRNILEIDYDKYAEGEAKLGWLNTAVKLQAVASQDWKAFAFELLRRFKDQFKFKKAEVAHLKLFITAEGTGLVGNLTSTRGMPFVFVNGKAGIDSTHALMILNARVHMDPIALRASVEDVFDHVREKGTRIDVVSMECFSPGRPKPTHRFSEVV